MCQKYQYNITSTLIDIQRVAQPGYSELVYLDHFLVEYLRLGYQELYLGTIYNDRKERKIFLTTRLIIVIIDISKLRHIN